MALLLPLQLGTQSDNDVPEDHQAAVDIGSLLELLAHHAASLYTFATYIQLAI